MNERAGVLIIALVLIGCASTPIPPVQTVAPVSTDASQPTGATVTPGPTEGASAGPNQSASPSPTASPPGQATHEVEPLPGVDDSVVALVAGVTGPADHRVEAWLRVYDALGIPVFGDDGKPLGSTGDDPLGPPRWRVWLMGTGSVAGFRFPLADLAAAFGGRRDPGYDVTELTTAMLADLRNDIADHDDHTRLFASFLREAVHRGPGQVDILDPTVTADQIYVTDDLAELIAWAWMRNVVTSIAQANAGPEGSPPAGLVQPRLIAAAALLPPRASSQAEVDQPPPQGQCAGLYGGEDISSWVNWFLDKIVAGGVKLPGMTDAFGGLAKKLAEEMGASETLVGRTEKSLAVANVLLSLLTLIMQLATIDVSGEVEPLFLERSKTTFQDGGDQTQTWTLASDPGKLPNGDAIIACMTSFFLNMFGVTLSFPTKGPIAGAEMTFLGEQGFGQGLETAGTYVQFPEQAQLRQDTDALGRATLHVQGKRPSQNVESEAPPVYREFSVRVSAQPQATTATTIFNVFWAGLMTGAGGPLDNVLDAAIEIIKTIHWDFGEHFFPFTDWAVLGQWQGTIHYTETIYTDDHQSGPPCLGTWPPESQAECSGSRNYTLSATIDIDPTRGTTTPAGDQLFGTAVQSVFDDIQGSNHRSRLGCEQESWGETVMRGSGQGDWQAFILIYEDTYIIDLGGLPSIPTVQLTAHWIHAAGEHDCNGTDSSTESNAGTWDAIEWSATSPTGTIDKDNPSVIHGSAHSSEADSDVQWTLTWDLERVAAP